MLPVILPVICISNVAELTTCNFIILAIFHVGTYKPTDKFKEENISMFDSLLHLYYITSMSLRVEIQLVIYDNSLFI